MADLFNRVSTEVAGIVPTIIESALVDVIFVDTPVNEIATIQDFTGVGITYRKGQTPTVVAKDLSEDGTYGMTDAGGAKLSPQSFAPTYREITAGVVGIDVKLTWPALEASVGNLEAAFRQAAAAAMAEKVITDLAARYTDAIAANELGAIGTDIDYALILAAHKPLWTKGCTQINCLWSADQLVNVLNIDEFKQYRLLGRNAIEQKLDAAMGKIGTTPFGSGMYWSPKVSQSGGAAGRGVVCDKTAWGMAIKALPIVKINMDRLYTEERAVVMSVTAWYGTGGMVDSALSNTRMVEVKS